MQQLRLPLLERRHFTQPYYERIVTLLSSDLDFHEKASNLGSHNFHSFPAKFPPQLPSLFIESLTTNGDTVLDPMMGSGTTLVEAIVSGRNALGFDIDPLATRVSTVKTNFLRSEKVRYWGEQILLNTRKTMRDDISLLNKKLSSRWDKKTKGFIDYWFLPEVQQELLALLLQIKKISDGDVRLFFEVIFSSIIITKSGGVSLALDLGHTRPHRAKAILDSKGNLIYGEDTSLQKRYLVKKLRSPITEFERRYKNGLTALFQAPPNTSPAKIALGDAKKLPLQNESIDLIVTSPPYASNAIDYMRAHKFTLVWFDYLIDDLGIKRGEYIGGEAVTKFEFEAMPPSVEKAIGLIEKADKKKGQVLRRYYSEMTGVLSEMFRLLKPGKAAIMVVGNSMMRGYDTQTPFCLAKIGENLGFDIPGIGVRNLDRNRRMMPASNKINLDSQIQQRMHEEYVIGFYKPLK